MTSFENVKRICHFNGDQAPKDFKCEQKQVNGSFLCFWFLQKLFIKPYVGKTNTQ